MQLHGWLVGLVLGGLGFVAGTWTRDGATTVVSSSSPPPPLTRVVAPPEARALPAPPSLTADEVRAILREELAQRDTPTSEAPRAPEPPTNEQVAAFDRANEIVDRALVVTTWTENDRARLREQWIHLTPAQLADLSRTVFPRINDGSLTVAFSGPIF